MVDASMLLEESIGTMLENCGGLAVSRWIVKGMKVAQLIDERGNNSHAMI